MDDYKNFGGCFKQVENLLNNFSNSPKYSLVSNIPNHYLTQFFSSSTLSQLRERKFFENMKTTINFKISNFKFSPKLKVKTNLDNLYLGFKLSDKIISFSLVKGLVYYQKNLEFDANISINTQQKSEFFDHLSYSIKEKKLGKILLEYNNPAHKNKSGKEKEKFKKKNWMIKYSKSINESIQLKISSSLPKIYFQEYTLKINKHFPKYGFDIITSNSINTSEMSISNKKTDFGIYYRLVSENDPVKVNKENSTFAFSSFHLNKMHIDNILLGFHSRINILNYCFIIQLTKHEHIKPILVFSFRNTFLYKIKVEPNSLSAYSNITTGYGNGHLNIKFSMKDNDLKFKHGFQFEMKL